MVGTGACDETITLPKLVAIRSAAGGDGRYSRCVVTGLDPLRGGKATSAIDPIQAIRGHSSPPIQRSTSPQK